MLRFGKGSIVNISSIAGLGAIAGVPCLPYVASKFAVRGMSKQLAVEYGPKNIRVNSIHPGFIKTPLLATAEQRLYDTARDLLPGALELDDTPWRSEYLYSRAATIYGGTAEIQRNIIARRLLDLGKE